MSVFRDLHRPGDPFVLANAWDAGSAKMLESMGAAAIATSSAAHAFTLGRRDGGRVSRDEALAHAENLVAAVSVPVSGDFENGFGDDPDTVAETVRLAAGAGLAGISVEDEDFGSGGPYAFEIAVERVRAGAGAARALPRDFVFCARADGVMNGHYGIDEALRRVAAFDAAGADCLYVPFPGTRADLGRVVSATSKPVNALAAGEWSRLSLADHARLGVARISLGSALARVTHAAVLDVGRAILSEGDFTGLARAAPGRRIDAMLEDGR